MKSPTREMLGQWGVPPGKSFTVRSLLYVGYEVLAQLSFSSCGLINVTLSIHKVTYFKHLSYKHEYIIN